MTENNSVYAPDFPPEQWSEEERFLLEPFASNPDGFVSVLRNLPPEIAGALCSRTSRTTGSLLRVLLDEYIKALAKDSEELAAELKETVSFLRERGFKRILNNQRAQGFYAKWYSQFGDDSIAQLTGAHLVFWGISQVAMKFVEDQRIGLEPLEKSTRYVNFGNKIGGKYLYYAPKPDLERLGLLSEYRAAMDHLFDTYVDLQPRLLGWLKENYEEKEMVLEKKSFDTLRGLLPAATLGQVAFRGNGQAFEYLINRSAEHELGELRWLAGAVKAELDKEIPSLLLRVSEPKSKDYQLYLRDRRRRLGEFVKTAAKELGVAEAATRPQVRLLEYDADAENKIVAALIWPETHVSWETLLEEVRGYPDSKKEEVFGRHFEGRTARWQKVARAFENSYLRFEIVMNIGAYRDLHRHRMLTQERQRFSTHHGYDVPQEIVEAGLVDRFSGALERVKNLFLKIEEHSPELAQYVVPLAYHMRFYQWENLREFFWETELRTIPQGHPDYRYIEQEKYRLAAPKFPLISKFLLIDMKDYKFARRGTEENIQQKERETLEKLQGKS